MSIKATSAQASQTQTSSFTPSQALEKKSRAHVLIKPLILSLGFMFSSMALILVAVQVDEDRVSINSVDQASVAELHSTPHAHKPTLGKTYRSIDVDFEVVGEVPQGPTDQLHLRASIRAVQNSSEAFQFQWILPDGVEVVSGNQIGSLGQLVPGEAAQLEIVVTNLKTEVGASDPLLHLQVYSSHQGRRIGTLGVFSLRQFQEMEETELSSELGRDEAGNIPRFHL